MRSVFSSKSLALNPLQSWNGAARPVNWQHGNGPGDNAGNTEPRKSRPNGPSFGKKVQTNWARKSHEGASDSALDDTHRQFFTEGQVQRAADFRLVLLLEQNV